ncbi:anks1b, partial [Symbiodinium sp. CCMP2592]
ALSGHSGHQEDVRRRQLPLPRARREHRRERGMPPSPNHPVPQRERRSRRRRRASAGLATGKPIPPKRSGSLGRRHGHHRFHPHPPGG